MKELTSLENLSIDALYSSFSKAFSDYEIQVSEQELRIMLSRRGFVPSLSFGLFDNEELVAFTLNGIGQFNGKKTAYDTGTGTLKEYRGQGLASKVFTDSIPFLKKAGVAQYLLEVLQHNTGAVSVYQKLGFKVSREFNYFVQATSMVNIPSKALASEYHIGKASLEQKEIFSTFCDFTPSWQNGFEAIARRIEDFTIIGAYKNAQLVGYCIYEPNSGDITQIAVDKDFRRQGIASALLTEALTANRHSNIKVINTEISCTSITAFLGSFGIPVKGTQFEMIREL